MEKEQSANRTHLLSLPLRLGWRLRRTGPRGLLGPRYAVSTPGAGSVERRRNVIQRRGGALGDGQRRGFQERCPEWDGDRACQGSPLRTRRAL